MKLAAVPSRTYRSPLRAEQALQTRNRIVRAAVDLLAEASVVDLAMGDVATRAGVSLRTVYRNFASREDLLAGVVTWINEQFEARAGPPPSTRQSLDKAIPAAVSVIFELEPLYRALFNIRGGRDAHQREKPARLRSIDEMFLGDLGDFDDPIRRKLVALLYLVSSSDGVLFLKSYGDLDAQEVSDALLWALRVLAEAAADPIRRQAL